MNINYLFGISSFVFLSLVSGEGSLPPLYSLHSAVGEYSSEAYGLPSLGVTITPEEAVFSAKSMRDVKLKATVFGEGQLFRVSLPTVSAAKVGDIACIHLSLELGRERIYVYMLSNRAWAVSSADVSQWIDLISGDKLAAKPKELDSFMKKYKAIPPLHIQSSAIDPFAE